MVDFRFEMGENGGSDVWMVFHSDVWLSKRVRDEEIHRERIPNTSAITLMKKPPVFS